MNRSSFNELDSKRGTKARIGSSVLGLIMTGMLVLAPDVVHAETEPLFEIDLKAATAGYRASKLMYRPVINDKSEVVGIMEDVILGADGKANFALIDVGSLSLGPHIVIIPFQRLKVDKSAGTVVLPGAEKADLQKLAVFP
jgi:hypothetical protein